MSPSPNAQNAFSVLFDPDGPAPFPTEAVRVDAGHALFDQGDFDDRLYILDEGRMEVSVLSAAGKKLSLNQMRAGAVFGEIAVLDPGPRTARIEALEPCRLRAIRQASLTAAMAAHPDLAIELLRLSGRRMRWLSAQVEEQFFLTPAARLAAKLIYLRSEAGDVRMSQAQLADYVGVTREVVSKTLSEWRRDGVVGLSRGRIVLEDINALEEIRDAEVV